MTHEMKSDVSNFDQSQSFWHLACIQIVSIGLPGIFVGGELGTQFGITTALTSVFIGNLLLWVIGFSIISMATPTRDNALENVTKYLGKFGGVCATLFLVLAFLIWYLLQINIAITSIQSLVELKNNQIRLGAALGMVTALISVAGMQFIRRYSVIFFPFFLLFFFFLSYQNFVGINSFGEWGISISGVILIVISALPGTVNLPTFFRHSKSIFDSLLGLTTITIFVILVHSISVLTNFNELINFNSESLWAVSLISLFIVASLVASNIVNIYFASAGWELIFPQKKSGKEYAIVGLLGTIAYTFLQISSSMKFLAGIANNFLSCLGIVLLLSFLIKIVVHHRPRPFDKKINFACWLFGGIYGTFIQVKGSDYYGEAAIQSICASLIAFILVIFVEEGIWSFKKVWSRR